MAKQDSLDPQSRDLVRFAAAIAQGYEPELRERVGPLRSSQVPVVWVEELLLQSVLMCGYPRALVAFGVWRKFSGVPAPESDEGQDYSRIEEWTRRGEDVCATVYHCLGIDPDMPVYDRAGRPVPVAQGGEPIREIVA